MTSHDAERAERAYVQSRLDHADHQLDAVIDAMRTDLDRLRDSWAEFYSAEREASEARIAAIREGSAEWLRNFYTDDADEPAPTPERAQPEPVDASPAGRSFPAGTAPAGHSDPWAAAEQAEAERIRAMSMQEFAARRAELGVRSVTDMTRLNGG